MSNFTSGAQPKLAPNTKHHNAIRWTTTPTDDGCVVFRLERTVSVPDVTGLSNLDAALAYAEAGLYVLPVAPETKNPGSVVGKGWPDKSSRDPEQISEWWGENPGYGLALHTGRSGVVVFDLDNAPRDQLPPRLADGLRQGVVQLSRTGNPDRGHYLFATGGEQYGNGRGAFAGFGDVRGSNGVIIVAPTVHVADDGEYRWASTGPLPELPAALRRCLSVGPAQQTAPLDNATFGAFLQAPQHNQNDRPGALDGVVEKFKDEVTAGSSRHEALVRVLPWAFREVIAGCYPASDAVRRLQDAFQTSFTLGDRDGRTSPAPNEFYGIAAWAAAQAQLADPAETLARLDRDDPAKAVVDEEAFWSARPELARLRDFARARRVAPWALFGVALARIVAVIPPSVVLPPLVGGHASLNLFVAVVAKSGGGKGSSESAAEDAIRTDPRGAHRYAR